MRKKVIVCLLAVCLLFGYACTEKEQTDDGYRTITWMNGTEILCTERVEYGSTPVYNGEIPKKDSSEKFDYVFIGFGDIERATEDKTYYAQYEEKIRTFGISFELNGGNGVAESVTLEYGQKIAIPHEPKKSSTSYADYYFDGWYFENEKWDFENDTVKSDMVLQAMYREEKNTKEFLPSD